MSAYIEFSKLCESMVNEVSTGLSRFTDFAAQNLLKTLHRDQKLGHDVKYLRVPRLSWKEVKDNQNVWFLLKGQQGWAAILHPSQNRHAQYILYISTEQPDPESGENVTSQKVATATDGNTLIANTIGKPTEFYTISTGYSIRQNIARMGAKANVNRSDDKENVDYLVRRFRPLFSRYLTQARADIKGVLGMMVKNDASRDKINQKIYRVQAIDAALEELESGRVSEKLKSYVHSAVIMAARYYYPELSGKLHKAYYSSNGPAHLPESNDGVKQLLSDIANGDQQKLGAVLAYLKRGLV